jgi:hypothetical protein
MSMPNRKPVSKRRQNWKIKKERKKLSLNFKASDVRCEAKLHTRLDNWINRISQNLPNVRVWQMIQYLSTEGYNISSDQCMRPELHYDFLHAHVAEFVSKVNENRTLNANAFLIHSVCTEH